MFDIKQKITNRSIDTKRHPKMKIIGYRKFVKELIYQGIRSREYGSDFNDV